MIDPNNHSILQSFRTLHQLTKTLLVYDFVNNCADLHRQGFDFHRDLEIRLKAVDAFEAKKTKPALEKMKNTSYPNLFVDSGEARAFVVSANNILQMDNCGVQPYSVFDTMMALHQQAIALEKAVLAK